MPKPHLDAIGLKPKGRRVYELADGSEIVMDITTGDIEFMGETVGGTILFGAHESAITRRNERRCEPIPSGGVSAAHVAPG